MRVAIIIVAGSFLLISMFGCVSFLPTTKDVVQVPWGSYHEVQIAYEKIARNETTVHQLKHVGFDIYSTPNVKILNYLDIAATVQSIKYEDLSDGLARCIKVRELCKGYQIEPKV